jgi:hypothetical protein
LARTNKTRKKSSFVVAKHSVRETNLVHFTTDGAADMRLGLSWQGVNFARGELQFTRELGACFLALEGDFSHFDSPHCAFAGYPRETHSPSANRVRNDARPDRAYALMNYAASFRDLAVFQATFFYRQHASCLNHLRIFEDHQSPKL